MSWNEKNVMITGASQGLGAALTRELAAAAARVVAVARTESRLQKVVESCSGLAGEVIPLVGDVGDIDAVHRLAGTAAEVAGPIDVLVHNASTLGPVPLRLLLDTECEDLSRVLEVNLVGPFRITKAIAGPMALRGQGVVLHVSSDAAVEAYSTWGAYSVSKAAQDHLSRVFAAELESTGVRFLSVDPGEMDTAMHAAALPEANPAELESPFAVAKRLRSILEHAHRLPNGARLVAADWSGAASGAPA